MAAVNTKVMEMSTTGFPQRPNICLQIGDVSSTFTTSAAEWPACSIVKRDTVTRSRLTATTEPKKAPARGRAGALFRERRRAPRAAFDPSRSQFVGSGCSVLLIVYENGASLGGRKC